ncbi:MAG: hypothetical protein QW624_05435 [Nitrososphaerota archaeon]
MILAEKAMGRWDLIKAVETWLNRALEEASDFRAEVAEGSGGWITVKPDEELIETVIRLQARLDPISSGKPPYTARVHEIGRSKIIIEYPLPNGLTVRKMLSASSFAAGLGYDGDRPIEFLEVAGIFEGAPISLAADMPSLIQLELLAEQMIRGLDRVMILNAAISEVDEISGLLGDQIAHHDHLTLSTHILYLRLGARLDKLTRKLREKLPDGAIIKPLPWKEAAQLLESGGLRLEELLARIG